MKCPFCGQMQSKVLDSRPAENGSCIRRRRECLDCQRRFTTYEKTESATIYVVKKGGYREVFSREKLLAGVAKACEKRPVARDQLELLVSDIERHLSNTYDKEVPSTVIGEMVMDKLRELDEVAYVRFASVYRQFKDIESFMRELTVMLKQGIQ